RAVGDRLRNRRVYGRRQLAVCRTRVGEPAGVVQHARRPREDDHRGCPAHERRPSVRAVGRSGTAGDWALDARIENPGSPDQQEPLSQPTGEAVIPCTIVRYFATGEIPVSQRITNLLRFSLLVLASRLLPPLAVIDAENPAHSKRRGGVRRERSTRSP